MRACTCSFKSPSAWMASASFWPSLIERGAAPGTAGGRRGGTGGGIAGGFGDEASVTGRKLRPRFDRVVIERRHDEGFRALGRILGNGRGAFRLCAWTGHREPRAAAAARRRLSQRRRLLRARRRSRR